LLLNEETGRGLKKPRRPGGGHWRPDGAGSGRICIRGADKRRTRTGESGSVGGYEKGGGRRGLASVAPRRFRRDDDVLLIGPLTRSECGPMRIFTSPPRRAPAPPRQASPFSAWPA